MHRTDGNCFPSLFLPKESREDEIFRKFPSNRSFIISLCSLCIVSIHFPRMYRNWQIFFKIQLLFLKAENKYNTIYKMTPSENSKTALGNLESISKPNQLYQDQTITIITSQLNYYAFICNYLCKYFTIGVL